MRTLFNQPIREGTTKAFYPDPITLEEFAEFFNVEGFVQNLEKLNHFDKRMYIEQWAESLLAWHEIEVE